MLEKESVRFCTVLMLWLYIYIYIFAIDERQIE